MSRHWPGLLLVSPALAVIAEDEALIRLDLAEMLAEVGYDIVGQAGDGQTAVELAEQHRPDLVVLDVKMPKLDGIAAAQRIAEAIGLLHPVRRPSGADLRRYRPGRGVGGSVGIRSLRRGCLPSPPSMPPVGRVAPYRPPFLPQPP